MKVTCPKCGYTWNTKSKRRYLTCPNCYKKIQNPAWGSGTSTSSTSTSTSTSSTSSSGTGTKISSKHLKDLLNEIKVYDIKLPQEALEDLRFLAEESSSDPSGLEVLVLDSDIAEEVLKQYGITLEKQG